VVEEVGIKLINAFWLGWPLGGSGRSVVKYVTLLWSITYSTSGYGGR
jgi:hypothetical protein